MGRFLTFLRELAVSQAGQTLLVVTHAGLMKHLLAHLAFANLDELSMGKIKNTGYMKLSSDGVEFFIEEVKGIEKISTRGE